MELAALSLQCEFNLRSFRNIFDSTFLAELGDYEESTHTPALVSEFRFVQNQNEEFELDVLENYRRIRYFLACNEIFRLNCANISETSLQHRPSYRS